MKSAEVLRNVGPGMTSDRQRCTKRARSLEDDSEDVVTKPTPKRVRLYLRAKEIRGEEEHITAGQDAPTDAETLVQASMVEEPSTNDETKESDDGFADDETHPTETDWDTAHGIKSRRANIRTEKGVFDVNEAWKYLYLPTSTSSPDKEKENLRVYIQDYGIQDWALLSQSTNRPKKEL